MKDRIKRDMQDMQDENILQILHIFFYPVPLLNIRNCSEHEFFLVVVEFL